jgi:DNA-binding NarL/FixJ family response regulator
MSVKTPIHIFIVENDNRIFIKMLDYIFTKEFMYRFLDFKSGEECLRNLHLNPDIVILDYKLASPEKDSILKQIKRNNPDTNVIVLISEEDGKQPSDILNDGANDYVLKENQGVAKIIEKLETFLTTANQFLT